MIDDQIKSNQIYLKTQ